MGGKIRKSWPIILAVVLAFTAGFGISYLINPDDDSVNVQYSLLSRRVQIDNPNAPQVNFTKLRSQLESYVNSLGDDSKNVSVYFEYLPTGVAININEQNEAIGASLMKVPMVMTLYKAGEKGLVDLDKKVALKQEWLNDEYGSLYSKGVGYEISIREAAELTLKESDNTALLLISDQIDSSIDQSDSVVSFLDLEFEVNSDERVLIGARSYASVLKCLYLACYNNKKDSQEMLEYMTKSVFNERLTSQLPDELLVAHKIGTFSTAYQSDCGVFYVPERNYMLCVMVKGEDPMASDYISKVSQKTYNYINTIKTAEDTKE